MIIKLVEICQHTSYTKNWTHPMEESVYSLRDVFINPEHVVCLREDSQARRWLSRGLLPKDIDKNQHFTRISMNRGQSGLDVIVIGSPDTIEEQLRSSKQLLKG